MEKEHLGSYILACADRHADKVALRKKTGLKWRDYPYTEFVDLVRTTARSLIELGVERGDMVGIFAQNRPEWAVADLAILSVGAVSVPIYSTNTQAQAEYIVRDAGLKLVFVGDKEQWRKLSDVHDGESPLEKLVIFEDLTIADGSRTLSFFEFLGLGEEGRQQAELERRLDSASSDDTATLIYTSGTTGEPKGVMLTHGNFFHQFRAIRDDFKVDHNDRSLCFLPLSHIYERSWSYYVFICGASNTYIDDPRQVVEYLAEVQPTAMVSVPRLYEKVYAKVLGKLERASTFRKLVFKWAVATGSKYHYALSRSGAPNPLLIWRYRLANKLVLGKIRTAVGGPKNFLSSGGAPLAKEIEEFFFAVGLIVCQGYGLSETSPILTCNTPKRFKFGTVGKPIREVELKLSPEGEILAKGPNITRGYHNKPEATAQAFVDGWFRTGDIGEFDADGFLLITDRMKDLIITSSGKNVAPQHIESEIGQDPFIEQIVTIGDKRKFISALVVPNFPELEEYARDHQIIYGNREELVSNPRIVDFYRRRIEERSIELAPYEKVRKFTVLAGEFTQEGGELTPTLKVKRKVIAAKYSAQIDSMYA